MQLAAFADYLVYFIPHPLHSSQFITEQVFCASLPTHVYLILFVGQCNQEQYLPRFQHSTRQTQRSVKYISAFQCILVIPFSTGYPFTYSTIKVGTGINCPLVFSSVLFMYIASMLHSDLSMSHRVVMISLQCLKYRYCFHASSRDWKFLPIN